jgi:multidrug efflux pump subunit AcrB
MRLVLAALKRPVSALVAVLAVALCAFLALRRMPVDIFPNLGAPAIYVAQPYGGMDPQQMEGFLTYYFEYHFLYITGIEHVESKNIQGIALMKLVFHPGTDMSQAMAQVVGYARLSHYVGQLRRKEAVEPIRSQQRERAAHHFGERPAATGSNDEGPSDLLANLRAREQQPAGFNYNPDVDLKKLI